MNVYISSSWKNRARVRVLAVLLREAGHEVYDFTDPSCRKTPELPPEKFPEQFDPLKHNYEQYLRANPSWGATVMENQEAIQRCDAVVLLLPCGNDAHADWAYGVGLGRRSAVVGAPKAGERTPTHLWATAMLNNDADVCEWLAYEADHPRAFDMSNDPLIAKLVHQLNDNGEKIKLLAEEVERLKIRLDPGFPV